MAVWADWYILLGKKVKIRKKMKRVGFKLCPIMKLPAPSNKQVLGWWLHPTPTWCSHHLTPFSCFRRWIATSRSRLFANLLGVIFTTSFVSWPTFQMLFQIGGLCQSSSNIYEFQVSTNNNLLLKSWEKAKVSPNLKLTKWSCPYL